MNRKRILSGTYSFLLPGLGQIYSGKILSSLVFFVPFAVCLYLNKYLYLLPAFSLSSSIVAFIRTKEEGKTNQLRDWTFAVTGFSAFMFWFLVFFYQGFFTPQPN